MCLPGSGHSAGAARVSTDLQMSLAERVHHPFEVGVPPVHSTTQQVIILYKARGTTQMRFRSQPLVALQCVVTGPPLKTAFIMFQETHMHANNGGIIY